MKNRTFICRQCGEIKRHPDEGRNEPSSQKHCEIFMEPLSHEQAYVATHLEKSDRLGWYEMGANILKGPSKRKRWLPALKDADIQESTRQRKTHSPKKPEDYVEQIVKTYYKLAEPYIKNNTDLLNFLLELNASRYIAHILFISVKKFREDIYQYIRDYNLNNMPKQQLREMLTFLISLVQFRDGIIENELRELWNLRQLDNLYDLKIEGQTAFPFFDLANNVFSLRDYATKCGVTVRQEAAPDGAPDTLHSRS